MLLNQLFKNAPEIEIKQISCDSRMPMEDSIFFCVKGIKDDGHDFIKEAIENGAKVIVYDSEIDTSAPALYIKVSNAADALNQIASKFYHYPAKNMENIMVAGSHGRNAVAFILRDIISKYRMCGYIGSYGIHYHDVKLLSAEPTLTILDNQRHLLNMKEAGVEACIFEASAMGIEQKKLDGVDAKAMVYTNTSSDSSDFRGIDVDYHDMFQNYISSLKDDVDVIMNGDDLLYQRMRDHLERRVVTYGLKEGIDFLAQDITIGQTGTSFTLKCFQNSYPVSTNLLGLYNVYNVLAAIATLVTRGYPINEVVTACKQLNPPEGIMEAVECGQDYAVVIDSARSLETMKNALAFAKMVVDVKHRIICLFGMNAYSDVQKRMQFGRLADEYADLIVLSEEDSFEVSTFDIAKDIEEGIEKKNVVIIENREDAIASAIELLNKGDMLLCLGKGNEHYMYRSLGREMYAGDASLARKYIKKRMEEENEISEVY